MDKPVKEPLSEPIPSVLVVGGSGTIGKAICQQFANEQWKVGIHYHQHQDRAKQTVQSIQDQGGHATLHQADLRNVHQVNHMMQSFLTHSGRLDTLVCAAGQASRTLTVRTSEAFWSDLLTTNLTATFYLLQAAGPIFHSQQHGSVILMGSLSSLHGAQGQAAYAASKAGLVGLMKTVAREWGAHHIRVNMVMPGWHQSPLSEGTFPDSSMRHDHVLGQTPSVQEVAQAVYSLARLHHASGQIWNLDSRIS